jgi:hypothetical protein
MSEILQVIVLGFLLVPFTCTIIYLILPLFGFGFWGLLHCMILVAEVFMLLWSYYKASFTSPGTPPKDWKPTESTVYPLPEYCVDEEDHIPHFCRTCNQFKPPRTHHCKYCKKCILKMDHHCPWINNCVGHANQKHFVLFIFYSIVSMTHSLLLLAIRVAYLIPTLGNKNLPQPRRDELIILSFLFALLTTLDFGLLLLFSFQMRMVLRNVTTIEYEQCRSLRIKAQSEGKKFRYPYEMSVRANFYNVFGENRWLWFIPTTIQSDGINFKTRDDFIPLITEDPLVHHQADSELNVGQ